MPAEWEKQKAVWISWPHNKETWPDDMLKEVENSYFEFVKALHIGQKVRVLANDKKGKIMAKYRKIHTTYDPKYNVGRLGFKRIYPTECPQPQLLFTFGLSILNPAFCSPSL